MRSLNGGVYVRGLGCLKAKNKNLFETAALTEMRFTKELLLNYQFIMNLQLWKVSNRHTLKARPPNAKLFAQARSTEECRKIFKSHKQT